MLRQAVRSVASRRLFSITPRRSNLVSDLYIEQIKQFKPTELSAQEIASAVKAFQLPAKASIPEAEVVAESLGEYEASEVETEAVSATGEPVAEEDWFVFEEQEDGHH